MPTIESAPKLLLRGLDGSNPLGFLAAIGTAAIMNEVSPEMHLGWKLTEDGWRPLIQGFGENEEEFSEILLEALKNSSMDVFTIDDCMPFEVAKFSNELQKAQSGSSMNNRRNADFLSSFGTDLYPKEDKESLFQDSKFRMVRRGDSGGQGLPSYVREIRKNINLNHIKRTVFHTWDYQDDKEKSLRWDPIEYPSHALRWKDPSKSKLNDGPGVMLGANNLAVEALRLFPSVLVGNKVHTTGFQELQRKDFYFVWPIWTPMVEINTLRSLLALPYLGKNHSFRLSLLRRRGVEEVYCSKRAQSSKYYFNFLAAQPR